MGSDLQTAAAAFGYTFEREDFQGPSEARNKVRLDDEVLAQEEGRYLEEE